MVILSCFQIDCKKEVKYRCQCTSPETYMCEKHLSKHLKRLGQHSFESMFLEPLDQTKEAILEFITKKQTKNEKLKKKILAYFTIRISRSEIGVREMISQLDSDSTKLFSLFQKINMVNKVSILEQDPILKLLPLPPDEAIVRIKPIIKNLDSKNYNCSLNDAEIDNQLTKIRESISNLRNDMKKDKKELEDWKKKIEEKLGTLIEKQKCEDPLQINNLEEKLQKELKNMENSINSQQKNALLPILELKKNGMENSQVNFQINELKEKKRLFLDGQNNSEIGRDFRRTCWLYENELKTLLESNKDLEEAYLDYKNSYNQSVSIYLLNLDDNQNTNLIIFDTENEKEAFVRLDNAKPLNTGTCLAQIPGGELFCFGSQYPPSGVTMMIDTKYKTRMLPSGRPCYSSSSIYCNRSIYCFGGLSKSDELLTLAERFDLDEMRWIKLSPLPAADGNCHCILFKENILISGYRNQNLMRYSIKENAFNSIPFKFAERKKKLLINDDRLYLIECDGLIYESEAGDEYRWKKIGNSIISDKWPPQVYLSYNKEAVYIGCRYPHAYYKFNLDEKVMIQL
ncbi:unnamed protein product [Blepharisma stoltei]|uniref:Kelch motif family protein n=1 Tax=Blepharisma stoltei TaxID=1481888 RepID=A0AAU9JEA3_9CILI|nr:unnamed protein product [Blepharisma stoltei]